jgi:hypothetical protein
VCTEGQEPPQNYRRQEGGVTFHTDDSQILGATIQDSAARQSGAQDLWAPAKDFWYSGNIRSCIEAQYSEEDCLHECKTLKP